MFMSKENEQQPPRAMDSVLAGLDSNVFSSQASCARRGSAQHAAGPWELVFPVPHERRIFRPLSELGQVFLSGMLERGFMGLGDSDICALVYPQSCAHLFW